MPDPMSELFASVENEVTRLARNDEGARGALEVARKTCLAPTAVRSLERIVGGIRMPPGDGALIQEPQQPAKPPQPAKRPPQRRRAPRRAV